MKLNVRRAVSSAWVIAATTAGMTLGGCATSQRAPARETPPETMTAMDGGPAGAGAPIDPVLAREPWSYNGNEGESILTPGFRIYSTQDDPIISRRMPIFLESALAAYRTAFTPTLGELPAPRGPMTTYIFGTRPQWAQKTQELLGPLSGPYLRIQRGGFAAGGRGVLFDLGGTGSQSTMAVASHEGWHQYTQSVFADPLPIWLEEGCASVMEGHRWEGATPVFTPWLNLERYDELRRAQAEGRLVPILSLLNATPAQRIGEGERSALAYYAQVWALVHFLREGEAGRHSAALERLLTDAADGRLSARLAEVYGARRGSMLLASRRGPAVFLAYFGDDMARVERAYMAFIDDVVAPGGRQKMSQGLSPAR